MDADATTVVLEHEIEPVATRLRCALEAEGYDALVLSGADLVGWSSGYFRYGSGPSAVVVTADGRFTLVVPSVELAVAEATTTSRDVAVRASQVRSFGLAEQTDADLRAAILDVDGLASARRVGVAGVSVLGDDATFDASGVIEGLRLVKDPFERDAIAHSHGLAWAAQEAVGKALLGDVSEIDLFSLARRSAERRHGSPIDFYADVVAGVASGGVGAPVAVPSATPIEGNDGVIVDLAVGASGYFGDITWTHLRSANDEVEALRAKMLDVLETVAAELRPGMRAAQVYRDVARRIADAAPGSTFTHHAGHGIGLAGYEAPFLAPFDDSELREGMVLAIEPGCYFAGRLGVRVERNYVLTSRGALELPGRSGMSGRD